MEADRSATCTTISSSMGPLRHTAIALAACISFIANGQWTALASGQQQTRSMTSQGGALYAVTFPSGVKKSTNGGSSWTAVNSGLPQTNGNYFVQSIGRMGGSLFAGTESGIYRSDNGGNSWSSVNGSLTANTQVFANKFFQVGNDLFAVFGGSVAQGGGIWKTDNMGSTWNIGHSGMGSNTIVNHLSQVGSTLYAATNTGIYTSTNNGLNWSPMGSVNYTVYGVAGTGGNLVMVSTFGMRYSNNGGASWSNSTGTPTSLSDGEIIAYDGKIYAIAPDQTGIFRSTNNGSSFSAYNGGIPLVDLISLEEFFADGSTLYAGSFTDIYSTPGSTTGMADADGAAATVLHPTVFDDAFTAVLPAGHEGGILVLLDATGRMVLQVNGLAAGPNRIDRGTLPAGAYHCVLLAEGQAAGHIGTVIAR